MTISFQTIRSTIITTSVGGKTASNESVSDLQKTLSEFPVFSGTLLNATEMKWQNFSIDAENMKRY